MLGLTSSAVAQKLSNYGDPNEIQQAIDNGDPRALGFIPKLAEQIKQRNPEMYNKVQMLMQNIRR